MEKQCWNEWVDDPPPPSDGLDCSGIIPPPECDPCQQMNPPLWCPIHPCDGPNPPRDCPKHPCNTGELSGDACN